MHKPLVLPAWLLAALPESERATVRPLIATPPVVFAVDQATQSGWSLHEGPRYVQSGAVAVHDWAARDEVFNHAQMLSAGRPMLFAYEDHAATPLSSYKRTSQVLALGAALGLWLDTIARSGYLEVMVLGIRSSSWRRRVLGTSESIGREELKRRAVLWARGYTGKSLGDDEAEACALGAVASREPLGVLATRNAQTRGKRCVLG